MQTDLFVDEVKGNPTTHYRGYYTCCTQIHLKTGGEWHQNVKQLVKMFFVCSVCNVAYVGIYTYIV